MHAAFQPILVLGMEGGAARNFRDNAIERGIVVDQQVARGRAHEHLDAGGAFQPLQHRDFGEIFPCAADVEREVAEHAMPGAPHFVRKRLGRGRERLGVGHLEHRRDPAKYGGAAAGLQILLVLQAGLAEVDLRVDHARQDVKAPAVEGASGRGLAEVADGRDRAPVDSDIPLAPAVLVHDDAAFEDEVEDLGHGVLLRYPSFRGERSESPDPMNTGLGRTERARAALF